ncbi:MAG: YdcF family protein [Clostridiales bacterium]|nr:YdcF family protein [Clostridiales bacterium]
MIKNKFAHFLKPLVMIICIFGFFVFVFPFNWGIKNIGNVFGVIMCGLLFFLALFWNKFKNLSNKSKVFKIIFKIVILLIILGFALAIFLSILMITAMTPSIEPPRAVIVLGGGLRGEQPSTMLARRLDAAKQYLDENSDAICIVSGGQGDNEVVAEAVAMYNYMEKSGVDTQRIYKESESTNTYENILFSKEILKEKGIELSEIAISTDGYHQFRASMLAKRIGYEKVYPVNADTDIKLLPTYWVREWFGILWYHFTE